MKAKKPKLIYVSDEIYRKLKSLKAEVPGHTQLYVNDRIIFLGLKQAQQDVRAAGFEPTAKAA